MPVVRSHHKLFFDKHDITEKASRDINTIITGITNDILKECP